MNSGKVQPEFFTKEKDRCPTCGHPFTDAYCAHCGEKRIDPTDYSLKKNFHLLISTFTNLDSRLIRSLILLISKPGLLTQNYIKGKRKPYLNPIKLFIILNAIYFFVQPYTSVRGFNTNLYSHMHRQIYSPLVQQIIHTKFSKKIPETYRKKFDTHSRNFARSLIFIMIPFLAAFIALLQLGYHRYFIEQLIFSTHFYAFLIFYIYSLTLLILNFFLFPYLNPTAMQHFEFMFFIVTTTIIWIYFYKGFQRIYPQKWWKQMVKTLILALSTYFITIIYRFLLFFIAFLTT